MKKRHFTKKERREKEALEYMSRRNFLGNGLKLGSSAVAIPFMMRSLFHETSAFAAVSGPAPYPVIQINLPGGWGGSVVPLDAGGNPLTGAALGNYGVTPNILSLSRRTQSLFGINYFDRSKFLAGTDDAGNAGTEEPDFVRGLLYKLLNASNQTTLDTAIAADRSSTGTGILNRIQAFTVANNGQDDNNTNPMGCNAVLGVAGFKGPLVDAVGLNRSTTGMRNTSVIGGGNGTPFIAPDSASIRNLQAYAPFFAAKQQADATFKSLLDNFAGALQGLGRLQAPRVLASSTDGSARVDQLNSAHADNMRFTGQNPLTLDPATDANYTAIFNNLFVDGKTLTGRQDLYAFATGLKALLKGQVNFVGYDLPLNYDYHGQIVADANGNLGTLSRDRIAGQMIGAIMNLAFAEGSNAIIVLTSDGATQGNPDHESLKTPNIWTGDRGQQNLMHFYVVNGKSTSTFTRAGGKMQIGGMRKDTGTVDTSTFSGSGDMAASSVIAANMLFINGVSPDAILRIFPVFASTSNLMSYIVFPS